jgi:hypothetical protein
MESSAFFTVVVPAPEEPVITTTGCLVDMEILRINATGKFSANRFYRFSASIANLNRLYPAYLTGSFYSRSFCASKFICVN